MISEAYYDGLIWCFLIVCGLFGIFVFVSLLVLFFAKPDRNGNLKWR